MYFFKRMDVKSHFGIDKILDNEDVDVNKNKIINLLDEWIQWLEDTKKKIMMMQDVTPKDKD